ncbi:hypothetical protein PSQ19_11105 [Devosia algicola]|uniref:Uncharacterized protein n=1 Tax=Devosia algicola TaxID=3026418 RepID=A0ABY7YJ89_9HYPH|nr:hypothetical protein [Devosia algicola]WDR01373.1 hypothetical protein PSQ19_11105 [Devosia algicola]
MTYNSMPIRALAVIIISLILGLANIDATLAQTSTPNEGTPNQARD